jgi:hypothetical protein
MFKRLIAIQLRAIFLLKIVENPFILGHLYREIGLDSINEGCNQLVRQGKNSEWKIAV